MAVCSNFCVFYHNAVINDHFGLVVLRVSYTYAKRIDIKMAGKPPGPTLYPPKAAGTKKDKDDSTNIFMNKIDAAALQMFVVSLENR